MVRIEEFTVASPGRSAEVKDRAIAAMGSAGVLSLVLRSDREVPAPLDVSVSFRIQQSLHLNEGGGTLAGERVEVSVADDGTEPTITVLPGTVTVRLAADLEEAATASMTVEN